MGNRILIYESGQRYEIDQELIYIPKFQRPYIEKRITEILPAGLEFRFDTVSDEDKDENTKETCRS